MKGNISRQSFREDRHYSGVFQVQGGMVTDADLGEQATIARVRADNLGSDTAGSGVPASAGVIDLAREDGPWLVPGTVYAEGVRGVVAASGEVASALALMELQADFPLAPTLPETGEFILYADVWERAVSVIEDPLVADPGFHGVETALRQRTMAQLKFAPVELAPVLGDPAGVLPRIGGGQLSANAVDPGTIADECDPCADTVAAEQTVANALFRIEVVHVHGDPLAPERICIAWSAENAAAVAPANVNPEDFGRAGAVYEAFSSVTEMHLGVHIDQSALARSSFVEAVGDTPADQPTGPDGQPWPFLRRWDGKADVTFGGAGPVTIGSGGVTMAGRVVTLTTGMLTATLDFTDAPVVAGDYWLIETRRFAAEPIRVVSAWPIGVLHHYCPLLRVKDGAIVAPSDAEERRLSFPTLPDIPATHVRYDNACPDLYHGAQNVQEALDALCDINASDIGFDPSGCPRLYDSVTNVQDALINLCKVDFGIERYMRMLMDWGVVCGIVPRRVDGRRISWTGGTILDRIGRLGTVRATTIEVEALFDDATFHFDSDRHFAAMLKADKVCLALSIEDGGEIAVHIAPDTFAFGPAQPTFFSTFTACREAKRPFDFSDHYQKASANERATIDKVFYAAKSEKLAGSQKLNSAEQKVARAYNDDLIAKYKEQAADEEASLALDSRIAAIDAQVRPQEASGSVRETLVLKREAMVYKAVRETEEQRTLRCLCDALLPRCPEAGEAPYLVPIACIRGTLEGRVLTVTEVCAHCCRKQALTWHTVQYFMSELRDNIGEQIAEACCPEPKPEAPANPGTRTPGWVVAETLKPDFSVVKLRENAFRSFDVIAGRAPPIDYRVNPPVVDLGIEQARKSLAGNGVEVIHTIDVADAGAIEKLRGASVGLTAADLVRDAGAVKPGDKVALITQGGVAVDYIKLDTGGSAYLFDQGAKGGAAVDFDSQADAAIAEFDTKLKDRAAEAARIDSELAAALAGRRAEIVTVTTDLQKLGETRAALTAELAALDGQVTRLRGEREAIARDMLAVTGELNAVKVEREAMTASIAAARAEIAKVALEHSNALAAAAKERDEVVTAIRRETPVTAVVEGNAAFAAALARGGVTNLDALAKLNDARLTEVARTAGVDINVARRMQRSAAARIDGPIG